MHVLPDLFNLTKQLSCTLDKYPKRKITKILNLQFQQKRLLNETKSLPVSAITKKNHYIGEENIIKLSTWNTINPLTNLPASSQFSVTGPQGTTGVLANPLSEMAWRNISPDWGWLSPSPSRQGSNTFCTQPHYYKQPLHQSTKWSQIAQFLMNLKRFLSLDTFSFI